MKNFIMLMSMIWMVFGCEMPFKSDDKPAAVSSNTPASCDPFSLTVDMVATTYTGTGVTTSGNCDNGGQEYIIAVNADYTVAASITGWRMINSVLTTNAGNVNFTTGGRFQNANTAQSETHGLTFAGIDNTTCQGAHGVNGTADNFEIQVTAEFDSDCVPQLRGTFKEYSQCSGGNPDVEICSGTIILVR